MARQIKFKDYETNTIQGGIMLDNGNVVCGCCGNLFTKEELNGKAQILKIYDSWVDLSEEICGDDLYDDDD